VSASARLGRALAPTLLVLCSSLAASAQTARLDAARWTRMAAESWLERAQARVRRGDTAEAITAYTEALRVDPDSGVACLELAELRRALGDMREAERLLNQATRISDVRTEALARRAQLYLSQQRSDLALLDLQAAVASDPTPQRLRELASFYLHRQAWVAALAVFRKLQSSLAAQTSEAELREAEETISALAALSAEADGAQHDMAELHWVRRALRHVARTPRKVLGGARTIAAKASLAR
jgi:tetratricopeptide (TPR) repeat protein